MRKPSTALVIVVTLAIAVTMPSMSVAQTNPQVPQPKGGVAAVIGIDQPENCLRIRSGPGNSYDVIGCANMGEQLNITGVWTSDDWAQLAGGGWVYGPQIRTNLRPPRTAYSQLDNYVAGEEEYPEYYSTYDYTYLPTYGYATYWYGGIPIIVYSASVWRKFHPWWWGKHKNWGRSHKAWNWSRNVQANMRTGTPRTFATSRSNVSSPNVTRLNASAAPINTSASRFNTNSARFNTRTFSSGPSNVVRSGRTLTSRSIRTFSGANAVRMGNVGPRQFSNVRAGGFSGARASGFSGAKFGGNFGGRRR